MGAERTLAFVSILSCGALMPDSLLSRTPGLLLRDTGGAPVGNFIELPFTVDIGRLGKAPEGGGWAGGGICLACNSAGRDGSAGIPLAMENDVPAEVGFEPIELPQVLPEKPLESDCRGRADLD